MTTFDRTRGHIFVHKRGSVGPCGYSFPPLPQKSLPLTFKKLHQPIEAVPCRVDLPEEFLHFLWKFRLFDSFNLRTAAGDELLIVSPGQHNTHAGPDFEGAMIRIGETLWAGNVEIHLRSSDWLKHGHTSDQAYDNVILHVVENHDCPIYRSSGDEIPALELKARISPSLRERYGDLVTSLNWIPCEGFLASVDRIHVDQWLTRVGVERLEEKAIAVRQLLDEFRGSWDDAFYIFLARNFGFRVNGLPFEMLARSLPRNILNHYRDSLFRTESLLFGQAGMLNQGLKDDYPQQLRSEYQFLRKKHRLQPIDGYLWKFLRLRPRNFPTLRVAQFAALLHSSGDLFSRILELQPNEIRDLFTDSPVSDYWNTHFRFDTEVRCFDARLGKLSAVNILVNAVSVFLAAYGHSTGSQKRIDCAIALQELLPAEINNVILRYNELGLKAANAFQSQALLQLKKNYCDSKNCLSCTIGVKLLKI